MEAITAWLERHGLGKYIDVFAENDIDLDVISRLSDDDLKELGLSLGDRRRLQAAIEAGAGGSPGSSAEPDAAQGPQAIQSSPLGEAERRHLTVMFADLVGSTELSQQLDPEDLRDITRGFQDAAKAAIESYEGFVARYMGDGVLAYFGYPQAHEDDAERAVRSGLDLIDAVRGVDASVTLSVRVGVATGPVVVGDIIGEGASQESAVVGETPNLAARLQGLTAPNTLVISDQTRRLTAGAFVYGDMGEHSLKGLASLVQAWEVRGESTSTSRYEALRSEAPGVFVGREHDLGMLLERWEQALGGDGQAVLISGEAGIGKSRLTEALRARVSEPACTWVRHQCTPYHTNSSLHPFTVQLERACGFDANDGDEIQLQKLESVLAQAGGGVGEEILYVLAELLSINTEQRFPPLGLTPQQRKARTFEALIDQLSGLAGRRPVVWIFEDAHWADPTSLELLEHMIDRIETLPALAVITARPEYEPAWIDRGHASVLALTRLSRSQSAALIEDLGGGRRMPEVVLDQIIGKTDGVPLFVEELTKSVLESGVLVARADRYELLGPLRTMAIPGTLQDSLMARLDRLGEAKKVAQTAAAIGREVPRDLLARITPDPSSLQSSLDELVEAGLMFRRGVPPAHQFVFKHALVQDAALGSMLRRTRQSVHRRIAEVLEADFHSVATIEPEVIAHHFTEAGEIEQAVDYWHQAGKQAAQRSAYRESVSHLTRALDLLMSLTMSPERDERELELQTALGPAQMAVEGFGSAEVERAYTRARELCQRAGRTEQLFQTLYGLFRLALIRAEYSEAKSLAEELLIQAERQDDRICRITAHRAAGNSAFWLGKVSDALPHLLRGVSLYDKKVDTGLALIYGDDPGVDCLAYAALAQWLLGYSEQAQTLKNEAVALARELTHPFSLARALCFSCMMHCCWRDWSAVELDGEELQQLAAQHGMANWVGVAELLLGIGRINAGHSESGGELFDRGFAHLRATGARLFSRYALALLADARARLGDVEAGLHALRAAENSDDSSAVWDSELLRIEGDLGLRNQVPDVTIEAAYTRALDIARGYGARALELRAAMSLGRLWSQRGRKEEAAQLISPLYEWFTEGLDTPDLTEAKALLRELS